MHGFYKISNLCGKTIYPTLERMTTIKQNYYGFVMSNLNHDLQ